jgi:hypothetical protein
LARAKRTDRTEARRRYRAEQAALLEGDEEGDDDATGDAPARAKASAPAAPRPSITAAFKGAYRPVNLRADLRALPKIVTQWGFLAASAATIGAAVFFVISFSPAVQAVPVGDTAGLTAVINANPTPFTLATLALSPPPAAGAFLVGFMATRASWLGGFIYGMVAALCFSLVVLSPAGRLLTGDQPAQGLIATGWVYSPLGAMLFAAAAAWYKRFLNLANPNRGRKPEKTPPKGRGNAKPNSRAASRP